MHDPTLALLTLLLFGSEIALAFSRRSRRTGRAQRADRGSIHVLWIVITASIATGVSLSGRRVGRFPLSPAAVRAIALTLFASGLALRWWAVVTLGRFFTVDVATHEGQTLVETGPFRFVRHPSYTGLLLAFCGFGVSLGNAVSVVVLMVPIVAALWYRMRIEEAVLRTTFGEDYVAYCARTKRLIPGVV